MAYNNMYYQQLQYPQQQMYQGRYGPSFDYSQSQQNMLKGRPVSSIDEAKAAQIDFDGSMFFFPDMAHNKIYTKQVMLDGTASLTTYSVVEEKKPEQPVYITKDEFDKTVDELRLAMKGAKNVQPKPNASKPNDQLPAF